MSKGERYITISEVSQVLPSMKKRNIVTNLSVFINVKLVVNDVK